MRTWFLKLTSMNLLIYQQEMIKFCQWVHILWYFIISLFVGLLTDFILYLKTHKFTIVLQFISGISNKLLRMLNVDNNKTWFSQLYLIAPMGISASIFIWSCVNVCNFCKSSAHLVSAGWGSGGGSWEIQRIIDVNFFVNILLKFFRE